LHSTSKVVRPCRILQEQILGLNRMSHAQAPSLRNLYLGALVSWYLSILAVKHAMIKNMWCKWMYSWRVDERVRIGDLKTSFNKNCGRCVTIQDHVLHSLLLKGSRSPRVGGPHRGVLKILFHLALTGVSQFYAARARCGGQRARCGEIL
jgi:hypothetical protein